MQNTSNSPVASMMQGFLKMIEKATVVKAAISVPWDKENLHILVAFYPEGRLPATLVVGRLQQCGSGWLANKAVMGESLLEGKVAFEEVWSESLGTQAEAMAWCTDGLIARGEAMVDKGLEMVEEGLAQMMNSMPPAPCLRLEMGAFRLIVADPPWKFDDSLPKGENKPKRGAEQQYPVLSVDALCDLPVEAVVAPEAMLGLWCPGALIANGLRVMDAWGFVHKQIWPWIKTSKASEIPEDDGELPYVVKKGLYCPGRMAFGMGRYGRGCSEVALVGARGRVQPLVVARNVRAIVFGPVLRHSAKPEQFQDKLERILPEGLKLELFARRDRKPWVCVGDEAPATIGEDIRASMRWLARAVKS